MQKDNDLMQKIVSLCKRRGFVFQSSEIYGGLRSSYDFGPLGVELKRNIAHEWWSAMVHKRHDIVGLDASIMMHPAVWRASGHVAKFADPLVDCLNCGTRFRTDKAPKAEVGSEVVFIKRTNNSKEEVKSNVGSKGIVCPTCNSPQLSDERYFNLMFRTSIGSIDPIDAISDAVAKLPTGSISRESVRDIVLKSLAENEVFLRPETAQAMFVQFANVQRSTSMKVPFGIAQIGRSFRNEVTVEHFIFRACEFEQMEMEFFVEPGSQKEWLKYWREERLNWWQNLSTNPQKFKLRQHAKDELAHYADDCYDIEYEYPWGFGELEGVASRTDYDLKQHSTASGVKLTYFDQSKVDPATNKGGVHYYPYVIEPAAGLTRAVLCFLLDAYREEAGTDAEGEGKTRVVLKLNPRIAPYKAAILPLVKKDGIPEVAEKIAAEFYKAGVNCSYDEQQSIGKRYAKHDEVGTPFCLTVDHTSLTDETVTIRDRDTTNQVRVKIAEALTTISAKIRGA